MQQQVPGRIVAAIIAVTITGITTNTLIGPAIPELLDEFGAPDSAAGYLIAAGSAPGVIIAPLIGFLADRFGRREVIVPCLVLFATAGGLGGLAPTLPLLVLARVFQGMGSAGLINLAVTVIGDQWSGQRRGVIIGRNSALLTVSIALLPFVGGVLTAIGGWRLVFAVYPVGFVTAVAVWRWLPAGVRRDVDIATQLREVRPLLLSRDYRATALATVLTFALIFAFLLTIVPVYVGRVFDFSPVVRGLILGVPAIGSTTGALLTGRLTGRWGRRRVFLVAATLFAVSLVVLAGFGSFAGLLVGILIFGLAEGLTIPALQDAAASAGDESQRGTLVATQVGMARLGQTTGPVLIAPVVAAAGYATSFLVGAVVAAVPLVATVRSLAPGDGRHQPTAQEVSS